MANIAIFGGTFDPPHLGHLNIANAALATNAVDKILFIPAKLPPHKNAENIATDIFHRVKMTALLVDENPHFQLSDLDAHTTNYTIDLVKKMYASLPQDNFRLLIGADMALTFGTWKEADELLKIAPPLIATRVGYQFPDDFGINTPINLSANSRHILRAGIFTHHPCATASSTIRRNLAKNGDFSGLTTPIADYIKQEKLYGAD